MHRLTHAGQRYRLTWPKGIWSGYPRAAREALTDHLAHLLTINMPLVSGAEGVRYNTAAPLLKPYFDGMVIGSIPGAFVGALIMGQAEELSAAFISTPMRDAIAFTILIIVLIVRPTGIFGEPEGEKA